MDKLDSEAITQQLIEQVKSAATGPEPKADRAASDRLHSAVDLRRRALDLRGRARVPLAPSFEFIDKPFLIWATRYGGPTDLIVESAIQQRASWATIRRTRSPERTHYLTEDRLVFYFLWQNERNRDVVVNVESVQTLNGTWEIYADDGWIVTPFWGQGTIGYSRFSMYSTLAVDEWWNQPPTHPVAQSGQRVEIASERKDGFHAIRNEPWEHETGVVSESYHAHYDSLLVPAGASVVFESAVQINMDGYKGGINLLFDGEGQRITAPYLALEVFDPGDSGPIINDPFEP
jgi:hypothetical protein